MLVKFLWGCLVICQLIASPEKIIVGLSADYPPFEFKQGEEVVGFDVDLAKEIGKQLSVEIEFKDMAFAMLFKALDQGEIDIIISSVTASEKKSKNFDFSDPYFYDTWAILHKSNESFTKQNLDNKSIACQLGASGMQAWLKNQSKGVKIVLMDAMTQMAEAIKSGHIDGALMDATQCKEFVKNSKDLAFTVVGSTAMGTAVALKKESPMLGKINAAIAVLKKNGTLKNFENKWIDDNNQTVKRNVFSDLWFIAKGLPTTLSYSFFAMCIGAMLGIFWAVSRHLKFGSWLITGIISILRGTPFLLQLSFVYFSAPTLLGIKLSVLVAGSLTLGINSAAYLAEILRSGLQSLLKGQFEVCQALGVSKWHTWKDIILPQVFRNVFPSLINEVVALTKETALVSVLGEMDIMRLAQALAAETYNYFEPMCLAGIIYYLLIKTIEFIGKKLEQRWHHA